MIPCRRIVRIIFFLILLFFFSPGILWISLWRILLRELVCHELMQVQGETVDVHGSGEVVEELDEVSEIVARPAPSFALWESQNVVPVVPQKSGPQRCPQV